MSTRAMDLRQMYSSVALLEETLVYNAAKHKEHLKGLRKQLDQIIKKLRICKFHVKLKTTHDFIAN